MDQAGVVVVLWPAALLDDAGLLVGDGGEAVAAIVHYVEVAQAEDDGHGHDGHHHQRDADPDAPWGKGEGLLHGLEGREAKTAFITEAFFCLLWDL